MSCSNGWRRTRKLALPPSAAQGASGPLSRRTGALCQRPRSGRTAADEASGHGARSTRQQERRNALARRGSRAHSTRRSPDSSRSRSRSPVASRAHRLAAWIDPLDAGRRSQTSTASRRRSAGFAASPRRLGRPPAAGLRGRRPLLSVLWRSNASAVGHHGSPCRPPHPRVPEAAPSRAAPHASAQA